VQVSPVQQPDPQGIPTDAQIRGAWQVPLVQVSPVQQPDLQGVPTDAQVLAARQVPERQVVPSQHSPLYTQERPSVRQTQTPAEQSMYPQQSSEPAQACPPARQQRSVDGVVWQSAPAQH